MRGYGIFPPYFDGTFLDKEIDKIDLDFSLPQMIELYDKLLRVTTSDC